MEPGKGWTQHELTKKDTPGFSEGGAGSFCLQANGVRQKCAQAWVPGRQSSDTAVYRKLLQRRQMIKLPLMLPASGRACSG